MSRSALVTSGVNGMTKSSSSSLNTQMACDRSRHILLRHILHEALRHNGSLTDTSLSFASCRDAGPRNDPAGAGRRVHAGGGDMQETRTLSTLPQYGKTVLGAASAPRTVLY